MPRQYASTAALVNEVVITSLDEVSNAPRSPTNSVMPYLAISLLLSGLVGCALKIALCPF